MANAAAPSPRRFRLGLAGKLAVPLVIGTAALFALFGYLNLRVQRHHSEALVLQSADRISDLIQRSTHYQMLRNDREALYETLNTIGREPGIRRIRIFNEEGRIRYSTDPDEIGRLVDKQAEACYACHAQGEPLTKLERPDRARIFTVDGGERLLGVIRPIENEPACANAACHAHPPQRRILGVIDADLSLATVDQQLAEQQAQLVRFTGGAAVLVSLASLLFLWMLVHRRVRELAAGTERVARGELDYQLPVRSQDELGALAESFNRMTAEVSAARAELTGWARTLEARVEEKSRELEQAQAMLFRTEKMAALGKLAATVAHEVNNPLAGILTYTKLAEKALEQAPLEELRQREVLERLRVVERESRRCGDILRNLLTFARQAPPRREPTDLNTLAGRALALVRHQLELQGIELEKRLVDPPPALSCDPGQIQQVLLALLVNAAEAMPRGGRLTVTTEFDAARDAARLRVRDTGSGIQPDVLPRIFEPFFTTKENAQRTGLGLAVAASIVEQHGGAIEVHSAPGAGTEFIVLLPREMVSNETPAEAESPVGAAGRPGGKS
jgi:two-component system NtrC family sensor kinase